ncbi:hypothetical protein, partial [Xylanibacillus composti]
MSFFLRVAIAQILSHAAYTDTTNLLMEPTGKNLGITKLHSVPAIKTLRQHILKRYLEHQSEKIELIIQHAVSTNVDILVFPEYTIPGEILPLVKQLADLNNIIIVSGSHMITGNLSDYYTECNIPLTELRGNHNIVKEEYIRQAVSPVFLGNGSVELFYKQEQSQWETNLIPSSSNKQWVQIERGGRKLLLGVKLCIDALKRIEWPEDDTSKIFVIPSYSPKTHNFDDSAGIHLLNGIPVCYLNEAKTGQSKVYGWVHRDETSPYLSNGGTIKIPNNEECLLTVDIDVEGQFGKNSTTKVHYPTKVISIAPLLYTSTSSSRELIELLSSKLPVTMEYIESVLLMTRIPLMIRNKFEVLKNIYELNANRHQDEEFAREVIVIRNSQTFWDMERDFIEGSIEVVHRLLTSSALSDEALAVFSNLRKEQHVINKFCSPKVENVNIIDQPLSSKDSVLSKPYLGRDEAITAFRRFINSNSAVCTVLGMRGIGKTEFLRSGVSQVLPGNWQKKHIQITEGTGFARFILMLYSQLNLTVNENLLENLTEESVERLLTVFFDRLEKTNAVILLIDDWHNVFYRKKYRDVFFSRFIERALMLAGNNKIIVTSQFRFDHERIYPIILNPLESDIILGILDWNIRNIRGGNEPINIPNELVRQLHGSPLAAMLLSQLLDKYSIDSIINSVQVSERFQNRLVNIVLEKITLTADELELLNFISVFNMPIEYTVIEGFSKEKTFDLLDSLTSHFLIEFNVETGLYQMHSLIKRHFLSSIPFNKKTELHKIAAGYYGQKIKQSSSPADKGEHISHLAHSLQFDQVKELRSVYIEEIRPVALRLFKERKFGAALEYYNILDNLRKNDIDVKFHIGLCLTHLNELSDAEKYINDARKIDNSAWWILTGYSDALTKNRHLVAAEKYANEALELMKTLNVPEKKLSAVYQTLALIHEKRGDRNADSLYKKAIKFDEQSAFVHYAYAKYLYNNKHFDMAYNELQIAKQIDSSLLQVHRLLEKITSKDHFINETEILNEDDEELW